MVALVVDETPAYHTRTVFAVVEWADPKWAANQDWEEFGRLANSLVASDLLIISLVAVKSRFVPSKAPGTLLRVHAQSAKPMLAR